MEVKYDSSEWTPCPQNCAYCFDMFFGHARPHPTQRRISDGKSLLQIERESKLVEKTQE